MLAAAAWGSRADSDELHVVEVLHGLLSEPECRAALILAQYEIDQAAVRRHFLNLVPLDPVPAGREANFSPEWTKCLGAAENLLVEYPRPLELATEHLLLGMVAADNDASRWLAECGLYADALEAEVHRLAGHQPGPLPIDIAGNSSAWVPVDEPSPEPLSEPIDIPETGPRRISQGDWQASGLDDTLPYLLAGAPRPAKARPLLPHEQIASLRILDAAANRAGEGLRVIEDHLRFALDDRHLLGLCKTIRHDLTAVLSEFPATERHAARDTQADVGTGVSLPAEQVRATPTDLVAANFKRLEQSLRSLEETAKLFAPAAGQALEQLRYRVYTLERAVDLTQGNLNRLANAKLYVLVDGGGSSQTLAAQVNHLVAAGVSLIQLRAKDLDDRTLLERAAAVREATRGSETLFIMNDRPDLALVSGADGVHLGQEDLGVKDARRIVGPQAIIGVSTHSIEQARQAVLDGASYIGVGPTFPSGTKQFAAFTGLDLLRAVQAEIRLPAFAIGGITSNNLPEVLATGFSRIAVSGAISQAADPTSAAWQLLQLLNAE